MNTTSFQAAFGKRWDIKSISNKRKAIGSYEIDDFSLVPSISVNRIDGVGAGNLNETDVLTIGSAFSMGLSSTNPKTSLFDYQILSLGFKWVGDTHFNGLSPKGELAWIPIRGANRGLLPLNHQYRKSVIKGLLSRNVFTARAQIGDISDGALKGERFLMFGATAGMYFQPKEYRRLEFYTQYTYLFEVNATGSDVQYLEIGARFDVSGNDQVFLEGRYRKGEELEKFTNLDALDIGLSFKF